jgi:hypothetical protein
MYSDFTEGEGVSEGTVFMIDLTRLGVDTLGLVWLEGNHFGKNRAGIVGR